MIIPRRSSNNALDSRYSLDFDYENAEPGKLYITLTDATTFDVREKTLRLDPSSTSGFFVAPWSVASAMLLGSADRIVLLDLERLEVDASILYEYEEFETLDEPRVCTSDALCVVASESRVTCFDRRRAARWCWSVRTLSSEWTQIAGTPIIEADAIRIPVRTRTKDFDVVLAQSDGARRS
ncbi:MAG TPA: hypothetical protein VIV40_34815 [Kofleriaceae bacterium]